MALGATAQAADVDHVLLISVDGLHALDVAKSVRIEHTPVLPGMWDNR